jgi:hypothetical protein
MGTPEVTGFREGVRYEGKDGLDFWTVNGFKATVCATLTFSSLRERWIHMAHTSVKVVKGLSWAGLCVRRAASIGQRC